MGKLVQETAGLNLLELEHDITVSAAGRGSDDVLVEGPRNKDYQHEDVHHGAHGAHRLGAASREHVVGLRLGGGVHLRLLELAQVATLEATRRERRPQPANE